MRVLVTGASGLVGTAVSALATRRGHDVTACFNSGRPSYGTPKHLDLTRPESIIDVVHAVNPEVIIHTAALTDVDQCERQPELAKQVNGTATGELGKAARNVGAHVTYVSTDYVFNGDDGNYEETARPNPLNHYGRSKLFGEELLTETSTTCCIARASVIYGWSRPQKPNFGLFVLKALEEKHEIEVADKLYSTPTLNTNLAEMLLELATRRLTGILHVSGATRISRFEFAREIANQFEIRTGSILPVDWRTLPLDAKRPRDSSLNVNKATKILNVKPSNLIDALRSFRKSRAAAI